MSRMTQPQKWQPKRLRQAILLACLGSALSPACVLADTAATTAQSVSIAAGSLDRVLNQFAAQMGITLTVNGSLTQGRTSPGLNGQYDTRTGLKAILLGTGLTAQEQGRGSFIIIGQSASQNGSTDDVQLAPLSIVEEEIAFTSNDWVYAEPRSVSVISRKQMDDRPARHAADILEQTSGVYSSLSQQDPALSVNIRGIQDFGRVNMNIDGIRQNYQKTGYGQRNGQMYIDPELLTGVTVEKGATNVMGSAGTLGGVASFNTVNARDFLTDDKTYGGKVSLGSGNNGTNFIGSGVIAAGNDQFDALLGISRRSFADYWPGSNGSISGLRINDDVGQYEDFSDQVKHMKVAQSAYVMESQIAKLGWNISEDERLQISYMRTATDTGNASALVNISNTWPYELGWKNPSDSEITSQNLGLDYTLKPAGQSWLDLTAKLYYADTKNDTHYHGSAASWSSTGSYTPAVEAYDESTRVQTYGLQAQNISQLIQGDVHRLKAVYGAELFYDTITSTSNDSAGAAAGATPEGNRTMGSVFANLNYDYDDWLTLQGGLRYDRYRLRGMTGFNSRQVNPIYTEETPCTEISMSQCENLIVDEYLSWHVNDESGKFSPTFFAGVKPGPDWLQLFASYGLSWRPPGVTETFASGTARAGEYNLYPNPLLEAERAKSWELGFNILKPDLFTQGDQLGFKVAYFATKTNNYISLGSNLRKPGYGSHQSGNAAFQNNLADSRFRGIEYQLNYDAGFMYLDASYTHMLGHNDFCYRYAWLGGATSVNAESGNQYGISDDSANNYTVCNNAALFSSSSYIPSSRGSVTLGGRLFDRKLDTGITMRFSPGYQDDSVGTNTPYLADWPKYKVYDFYASYPLARDLMLRASIENLTDEAYIVSYGESIGYTLSRGRTVQASLEYRF